MDSGYLNSGYWGDLLDDFASDSPSNNPATTKDKATWPGSFFTTQPKVKRLKREEDQTEPNLETKDPDLTSSDANPRLQTVLDDLAKTQEKIARDEAKVLELKAKEQALTNEATLLRRKPKLAARKESMLDIEDWEVRYLATSHFGIAGLRVKASQWVESGDPPALATTRHIKTVLFDALTEIDDEQLRTLLSRMQKYWK
ncbi:hypothetical protein LTR84_009858 [Exophiala bonariae]|uniref:Kinetochore protein Spc24 n=1 Tax=Exophiala bonariae TaxID=1690606 RepID=A0AAV9NJK5_9EURO|nr:hypothetical protein LTR84_009858 [Exophiala bonariae]